MARFATVLALALAVAALPLAASAQQAKSKAKGSERRGGYSYSQADSINTYGDNRGAYGSANSLRDPQIDRQTNFGPFDHGFFYDSGVGARGGNSPYLN